MQIFQIICKYGDLVFLNEIDVKSINFYLVLLQCVINYEYIVESQCYRDFKFIDVYCVYIVKYLKVVCGLICIDCFDCCIIIYFKLQIVGLLCIFVDCENI